MIHKKVRFKGNIYWLHQDNLMKDMQYLLISPLDHFNAMGDLLIYEGASFALLEEGEFDTGAIFRFGEKIGTLSDLTDVGEDVSVEDSREDSREDNDGV